MSLADTAQPAKSATPARAQPSTIIDGCRILRETSSTYRDGAEQTLLNIMNAASDLSSLSDELAHAATTWPEQYHLSLSRANVVRPFQLEADMSVLEVGAGCGAVTRFLGETCGVVDAVEPVVDRARVARARTKDLDNVAIFVGDIDDIPAAPTYDVVVVIGVLEYVAGGTSDTTAYVDFLTAIAKRLKDGGSLLLAIENRLGAKYIAGAPEDHSGRVFDSIENYPGGTPARTFSRRELTALTAEAGLTASVFGAFPDYKMMRALLSDALFETQPSLAWCIPHFPSYDPGIPRPHLASERHVWRTLVESGLGPHTSNSFVVLATKGATQRPLWPEHRLASYYGTERRSIFTTETAVERRDAKIEFIRRKLDPPPEGGNETIQHIVCSQQYETGIDMLERLSTSDDATIVTFLHQWVALLDGKASDWKYGHIDINPANIIISADGTLVPIDDEWHIADYSRDSRLARGVILTARALAEMTVPKRWSFTSPREIASWMGDELGLNSNPQWIDDAIHQEAMFQTEVCHVDRSSPQWDDHVATLTGQIAEWLSTPLTSLPLGERCHQTLTREHQALETARREIGERDHTLAERDSAIEERDRAIEERDRQLAGAHAAIEKRDHEINALLTSRSWRMTRPFRAILHYAKRIGRPGH